MFRLVLLLAALVALPAHAFDLQGHRGARGLMPENTLPAFQKALDLGVDTIECDMAITKDGVVVIHHDLRLNPDTTRGPDGKWLDKPGPDISALTFDELQRYDVGRLKPGTDYAKGFPDQQPVDGTRIPRLSDLFDLVKKSGNDKIGFDCETKISPLEPAATLPPEEFARRVIAEIRKGGMERRAHDPVVRLADAAGRAEGGAGDPDDVSHLAANAGPRRRQAARRGSPASRPSSTAAACRAPFTRRAAGSGRPTRRFSRRCCSPRHARSASS